MKKRFSFGFEAINYQTDGFFQDLCKDFDTLLASKYRDEKAFTSIEEKVKKRFGLIVHILKDLNYGTCVWIPTFHQNHIFCQNELKNAYKDYSENIGELKLLKRNEEFNQVNVVSIKEARVSGLFSKIQSDININTEELMGMSSEEVCAVFLHEVGHLFTYFENIMKMNTTNMVLLQASAMAEKHVPLEEKQIYLKEAEKQLNLKNGELNDIVDIDDSKTVFTVLISKISHSNKSSTDSYFYDDVACEQLADQFVARLGGGRHLLMALDHLNTKWGTKFTNRNDAVKSDMISTLLVVSMTSLFGLYIGVAFSALIIPVFIVPLLLVTLIYKMGTGKKDHTYDENIVRLTRMKNDLIASLKTNLPPDVKRDLIKEIEMCDKTIKSYVEYEPIMRRISDFIFKTNRDAKKIYTLQRDLEEFNFNNLFVKSQQLSLISN